MKRGSTFILRGAVIAIGLAVLAICVFALPQAIISEFKGENDFDYAPVFIGLYIAAIPFYIALLQSLKLLNYIDDSKAFSNKSVRALKNISYCALIISALFTIGLPYVFILADRDDAPGLVAMGLIIIGASFVIATFAGVLKMLLQNALVIKAENDLTV